MSLYAESAQWPFVPNPVKYSHMHVDLQSLAKSVEDFSKLNGFETRTNFDLRTPPTWFQIQSMKAGIGRTIVGARRCLNTVIRGDSDDFEVSIGTSDWGKNLTAALITGSLTLGIGFLWAGASAATYKMFEEKLSSYINDEVLRLSNTGGAVPSPNGQMQPGTNTASSGKYCGFCGGSLPTTYTFCPSCGTEQTNAKPAPTRQMATATYANETRTEVRTPTPQKLQGPMGVIVIALLLVIVVLLAGLLAYLFSHTFTPLNMRQIATFMKDCLS